MRICTCLSVRLFSCWLFPQKLMQRSKAMAFAGWREGVAQCARKRELLMHSASHFLHQRLGACFLIWRAATQQKLLQQDQAYAALLHWTQGSLSHAFQAWHAWSRRRVAVRIQVAGGQGLTGPSQSMRAALTHMQ